MLYIVERCDDMRNIKDKKLFPGVLLILGVLCLLTGITIYGSGGEVCDSW